MGIAYKRRRPAAMTTGLSETAAALKRDHGHLLAGEPSRGDEAQRQVVEAIEAARVRLCGNDRLASGQLALDVAR